MTLSLPEFDYVRRLVFTQSAIELEADKTYLVESRLSPLARNEGCASLTDLVQRLQANPFNGLHRRVVEAMTTNETSFFRDFNPFEALKKFVLPKLIAQREAEKVLNFWCAACSSGQEPYSLAMLIRENFPQLLTWKLHILASDLSTKILARAREARYSQLEVNRGLPAALLVKHFEKRNGDWHLREDIRNMVDFHSINLANVWPQLPSMDVVMIRNVLIYFSIEAKREILGKIRNILKPEGYLFLGSAETTFTIDDSFQCVQFERAICYQPEKC